MSLLVNELCCFMPSSLTGDEDFVSYRGIFQVHLLLAVGFKSCLACPDDSRLISGECWRHRVRFGYRRWLKGELLTFDWPNCMNQPLVQVVSRI